MIIIETCPKCGYDIRDVMLTCNPPILQKYCPHCGWSWSDSGADKVIRVPFNQDKYNWTYDIPPACRSCNNHPSNGGSGICWCTRGQYTIT